MSADDREPREVLYDIDAKLDELLAQLGGSQSTNEDAADVAQTRNNNPWSEYDGVHRRDFLAVLAVREFDGHPKSRDLDETFTKLGYAKPNGQPAASSALTKAFKNELVGRTPKKPYRYWATGRGETITDGYSIADFF